MPEFTITDMQDSDWESVERIYLEGIAGGNATFETNAPAWDAWNGAHLDACRLVVWQGGHVIGWAALSPVSSRCVYAGVAEVSVYLTRSAQRQGLGHALLTALIEESEQAGIWTLQAGIFPENRASLNLLLKCGFRRVGVRERIGQLAGVWRDVLLLERRSARIGP